MDDSAIIAEILVREGWPSYTDDPADRGGPTKGGITLATLSAWRGRPCTIAELQALAEPEAREIYRRQYITGPGFTGIADADLRHVVVDAAVLHGQGTAARGLQAAANALAARLGRPAGLRVDGQVGRVTLAAVNGLPAPALRTAFVAWRIRYVGDLVQANANARAAGTAPQSRDQARFCGGWLNRATSFLDTLAGEMAQAEV